jgi:hypothetical protein
LRLNIKLSALIIAYSRPEGVSYLVRTLISYGVSDIYISVDGPKNDNDIINQLNIKNEVIKYSKNSKTKIHLKQNSKNLGVAGGVISAIDWFFSFEEMGVILEDDLLISEDFLTFTLMGLETYKKDPRVWMVSGTQVIPDTRDRVNAVWTNYPMIWGWGSWKQKWIEMRVSLLRKKEIRFKNLAKPIDLYWAVGGNRALSGKVDTWDTQLACEFRLQKKLCLLPPVNLVSNIGTDEVASHTKVNNETMNLKIQLLDTSYVIKVEPERLRLLNYNASLESKIFRIKTYHLLLPYYAFLFDFIKFPKSKRKPTLVEQINNFER